MRIFGRGGSAPRPSRSLRSRPGLMKCEFVSFARGLGGDYGAMMNALRFAWGSGQLEGQVNRLRLTSG